MIQLFQPYVGPEEWDALRDVLRSGWLGAGPVVNELETRWQQACGGGHCLTMHNATEALFQAVDLLRWDAEVVVPAVHFIGAGNAVAANSTRRLRLADVDPTTLCVTADLLASAITKRTEAVLLCHVSAPCDMQAIQQVWRGMLIEDAAAAPFALTCGKMAGTWGDVGIWSLDAMKPVTAGDGGMVWCRDEVVHHRLRLKTRLGLEEPHGQRRDGDWWELRAEVPGRLSQMNDLAAAVALVQCAKRQEMLNKRHTIAGIYWDGLSDLDWLVCKPFLAGDVDYFFWVQTTRRGELARFLRDRGIYTSFRYWPLHWAMGRPGAFLGAEQAARTTLLLPCHAAMSLDDAHKVVDEIRQFGRGA